MAALEDEVDDRFKDIDIETLLSRVERRPLTFSRKRSVLSAPEFSQRLKGEETVDEGGDLTLSFKVNGIPRPILRWFKDDEEVKDHARLTVQEGEEGKFTLTLHQVNKGDSAAYRCRAENSEGSCSSCFFLSVKGKPKSPKRDSKKNCHKRTVSYPTMFSTIVEKVEEEEYAGNEASKAPASPLTPFYDSLTLKGCLTWQEFLGDWAFVNGGHKARGGSTGSYTSSGSESEGPRDPDDVVRIFADAEGWEPDDVFLDSPTSEGRADFRAHLAATQDVVLLLQAAEQRTHGVGAVPAHAHLTPEESTSRGQTGQLLKPSVIGQQKDSKEVSPGSGKGVTSSSSSSPLVSSSCPAPLVKAGGNGKASSVSSPSGGSVAGQTVSKDKAKQTALSSGSSSPSSSPSPSSSVVTKPSSRPRLAPGQTKSASDIFNKNSTASAVPSRSLPRPNSKAEPDKKTPQASASPVRPPGGFSLSTDTIAAKDGSAKPVSVRGPFGALISSSGDAGKKTAPRGPSTTKKASSATAKVVSSTPSKDSPAPPIGPTLTLTPSSSAAPCLVVTPDSDSGLGLGLLEPEYDREEREPTPIPPARLIVTQTPTGSALLTHKQQRGKAGKMCDCGNSQIHLCNYTSSSGTSCGGSGTSSDDSSVTSIITTTITTSLRTAGSLASTSSQSPTFLRSQVTLSPTPLTSHNSLGLGLLAPEHDREEREPTPIPPDRLIVTQLPTGSSVLFGMYKGNIHPPVHPVPSQVADRKGETETEKEKDKRKDQKVTEKDKLKSGAGQPNVPFVKRPGESAFTRELKQQPQQHPPGSKHTPSGPSAKSGATEALFFDPVNQELVHVKRFNPDPNPEPARSRSAVMEPHRGKWATREPPRRSPSPGPKQNEREREKRARAKSGEKQKAHSASALYTSIANDPERELVYQYFRELAFVLCLLTFLGLLFNVRPHIFVGVVLGVHLALFFSRKYIFIRKPIAK